MSRFLSCILLSCACVFPAAAAVNVTFTAPEHFTDAEFEDNRPATRAPVQEGIRAIFTAFAHKYLGEGRDLSVEVTDIDLAGRFDSNAEPTMRLMIPVTWPRIQFNYTITENGAQIAGGKADLSDMSYLDRINLYSVYDRLRYEREMLRAWFVKLNRGLTPQTGAPAR